MNENLQAIREGRASARAVAGPNYARAYKAMAREFGCQPFGYDRITLRLTAPGWLRALDRAAFVDARNLATGVR